MFTVLFAYCPSRFKAELRKICLHNGQFHILEGDTSQEIFSLWDSHKIDSVFLFLDSNYPISKRFISHLRKTEDCAHIPLFLFSTHTEYLLSSFIHWHCCEFFLLPLMREQKENLIGLIQYYDKLYQKMHTADQTHCQLHTPKGIFRFPYDSILFIESAMKKSFIHTVEGTFAIPLPLYRVKETLLSSIFVHTHRSFIANLENISYIDKTKDPWVVSFYGSEKCAFVSRSYKKEILQLENAAYHHPAD